MSAPVRRIGVDQRRARLGVRHHLGRPAADVVALADRLCGLHATDPITPFLSARARLSGFAAADLERALYDERTALRLLGMRRTVFVVPTPVAPLVHQACTAKIDRALRTRLAKELERNGVARDGVAWLAEVEADVVAVLGERGELLADELSAAVPALRTKITMAPGKSYGADVALTSRILTGLGAAGRIVRGRPQGRWNATRYRWALLERWAEVDLTAPAPPAAEADLARRWLYAFGPATEADLRWWAGWTLGQTRRALAEIGAVPVDLDGAPGWLCPDDLDDVADPSPWVALLPALDPTAMGWTERDWYLGPHREHLFDRAGNVGPTIWADGRIVGGWAQRADGEIAVELLEDVGAETRAAVDREAEDVHGWLGDVRYRNRFATPLARRLAS